MKHNKQTIISTLAIWFLILIFKRLFKTQMLFCLSTVVQPVIDYFTRIDKKIQILSFRVSFLANY